MESNSGTLPESYEVGPGTRFLATGETSIHQASVGYSAR